MDTLTAAGAPTILRRLSSAIVIATASISLVVVLLCVHFWLAAQDQVFDDMALHIAPANNSLLQFHQTQQQALLAISQSSGQLSPDQLAIKLEQALADFTVPFEYLAVYRNNGQRLLQASLTGGAGEAPLSLFEQDMAYLKQQSGTVLAGSYRIAASAHLAVCKPITWIRNRGYLCAFSNQRQPLSRALSDIANRSLEYQLIRADGVLLLSSNSGKDVHRARLGEPVSINLQQAVGRSVRGGVVRLTDGQQLHRDYYSLLSYVRGLDVALLLETPLHRLSSQYLRTILPVFAGWLAIVGILLGLFRLQQRWLQHQSQQQQQLLQQNKTLKDESALLSRTVHGCIYRATLPDLLLTHITHDNNSVLGRELQQRLERHNSLLSLMASEDQESYLQLLEQHKTQQQAYEMVYRLNSPEQELRWILDRGSVLQSGDNRYEVEGFLVDITDQTLSQQHINYLATRDPLTELGNRYWFNDELISYTRHQANRQRLMALLFIDLDRFKTINDSLGHQFGDHLLKEVAARLKSIVPEHYPLARLGGDEFMIMVTDGRQRADIEHMARRIISTLSETYRIEHFKLNTSCSIGISLFPHDSSDAFVLMRNADTAMYQAKSQGGNGYQFYTDDMNQRVNSRLTLENELRRAIQAQEFELYYQPQVCTKTNELLGAEALIRWQHPDAGIISPADFIPVAEDTGLINDIGDWALREACSTFYRWNMYRHRPLPVAVNVSVRQLSDGFPSRIKDILDHSGLSPSLLELEITESLLMDNVQQNVEWLDAIHALGINFAMDDFGTGYSSLSYLKQFPISKLKIDRAFIMDITSDVDDEAIVRAILAMAHSLRLKVVAEGVETEQQLEMLKRLQCNSYQGYYFSKPVDKMTFEKNFLEPMPMIGHS
ncbi:hypothetical protein CHH28_06260 [Bacterioplanes sanyensis]|uniref:cyclic-guanylate-specific phosphodiesterase n=1 Tax=Bacterioplanes sanyensis TaxID=1249553 RepID=A0A222FGW2_9GAMM|nr:GGDEF domain-containing phosphodiesterase [Bacterioplanes sanyensis]ASP38307.1 hypothetical protein CHH28_06260 [Bacterioplanes sanyensis]